MTVAELAPLDWISLAMDRPRRRMDFALLLELRSLPPDLEAGAHSARRQFPLSGCKPWKGRWVWHGDEPITVKRSARSSWEIEALAAVNAPFLVAGGPLVRQLLLVDGATALLVTRMHHGGADGVSALAWVEHQLDVAYGARAPVTEIQPHAPPVLRRHDRPDRSTSRPRSSLIGAGRPTGERALIALDAPARSTAWFAALLLDRLGRGAGLWFPVNARHRPFDGFGNGTSRVRLHAVDGATPEECAAALKDQLQLRLAAGEWSVPDRHPLLRLPPALLVPALRLLFSRPGLDMGSAAFTHLSKPWRNVRSWQRQVARLDVVGNVHERQLLSLVVVTLDGASRLSFTFDPGRLPHARALAFARSYQEACAA